MVELIKIVSDTFGLYKLRKEQVQKALQISLELQQDFLDYFDLCIPSTIDICFEREYSSPYSHQFMSFGGKGIYEEVLASEIRREGQIRSFTLRTCCTSSSYSSAYTPFVAESPSRESGDKFQTWFKKEELRQKLKEFKKVT